MQYVMLIYHGTSALPGSQEWAGLSEEEQKQVYADYGAINKTPGVTPPWVSPRMRPRCASRAAGP